MEQTLACVFASVLNLDRISSHDNFFTVGGDSLKALQIVSRASREGIPLSVQALFLHQTIAERAQGLQSPVWPRCLVPIFGKLAAVALCLELEAAGRDVERVVMLNAIAPRFDETPSPFDLHGALSMCIDMLRLPMDLARLSDLSAEEAIRQVVAEIAAAELGGIDPGAWLSAVLESMKASVAMMQVWQPRAPRAPVHLLRAAERTQETGETADLGWSQYLQLASRRTRDESRKGRVRVSWRPLSQGGS